MSLCVGCHACARRRRRRRRLSQRLQHFLAGAKLRSKCTGQGGRANLCCAAQFARKRGKFLCRTDLMCLFLCRPVDAVAPSRTSSRCTGQTQQRTQASVAVDLPEGPTAATTAANPAGARHRHSRHGPCNEPYWSWLADDNHPFDRKRTCSIWWNYKTVTVAD